MNIALVALAAVAATKEGQLLALRLMLSTGMPLCSVGTAAMLGTEEE
ncbi:MAG TPA: hypothetical protein V6D06_13960 [Trichocoleus sp.]